MADAAPVRLDDGPPLSVRLAFVCLLLFAGTVGGNFAYWVDSYGSSTGFLAFHLGPLSCTLGLLYGLWRRHQAAHVLASAFTLLGAVLLTPLVLVAVAAFAAEVTLGIGVFDVEINGQSVPIGSNIGFTAIVLALVASLLWVPFFALRLPSARRYFGELAPPRGEEPLTPTN